MFSQGTRALENIPPTEDFFFFLIFLVSLWGDGEPLAPKAPVSDRWSL